MKTKYNVPHAFMEKKDALIKRLEKKHYVSISDLEIYMDPFNSQQGEMVMTLDNGNHAQTDFVYRKRGFVFKFSDGDIDMATVSFSASSGKPILETEFEKVKEEIKKQICAQYKISRVDFEIIPNKDEPSIGTIKMRYKNFVIAHTYISYRDGKFYFDFTPHSGLIEANIKEANKR